MRANLNLKTNLLDSTIIAEKFQEPMPPPGVRACLKTLRAARLWWQVQPGLFGFVVARVTARSEDAPPAPPRPQPKSLAAAPLPIFRQALRWLAARLRGGVHFAHEFTVTYSLL
jgi:hypothetical protein